MTDRKGKRAIIINNIKSDSIEQAIFILKPSAESRPNSGGGIVAEAQEIINSYIKTMERAEVRADKKGMRKIGVLIVGGLGAAIIMLCALLRL